MTSTALETSAKKVSKSETGHYKNLANLNMLIESLKSYGALYNPSNPNLGITSLETLSAQIDGAIAKESSAEIANRNAVRERDEAYERMGSLATRIQNAVASCASENVEANAKSYTDKIRGGGKKKPANVPDEKTKSTSQLSFDNRMKNLSSFCRFLETIHEYKPNESDLQTASILAYIKSLDSLNKTENKTWNELDISRKERDRLLYGDNTGATELAKKAKKYVKSAFGSGSGEYKRISKIKFVVF